MTYRIRLVIMFSFIAVFLILTPLLLLYSSGYRFDFKRRQLVQTGTLFLEARDVENAEPYINGVKHPNNFTDKLYIYDLLPGNYTIKLMRDGFFEWEKTVSVAGNFTTFEKNIILVKKSTPSKILDAPVSDFYFSPDKEKIAYTIEAEESQQLYVYEYANQNSPILIHEISTDSLLTFEWAPSSRKLLLTLEEDEQVVIDVSDPNNSFTLENRFGMEFESAVWDYTSDDTIFGIRNNAIYKLGLNFETSEKIVLKNLSLSTKVLPAIKTRGANLYFMNLSNGSITLSRQNELFESFESLYTTTNLYDFNFSDSPHGFVSIVDRDQDKIVVVRTTPISQNLFQIEKIKELQGEFIIWEEGKSKNALFYDEFEIHFYNQAENQDVLINRYGKSIQKVIWHPQSTMIAVAFENEVQLIDLFATNNARNIYSLAQGEIIDINFDEDADHILISGTINNERGLWKVEL